MFTRRAVGHRRVILIVYRARLIKRVVFTVDTKLALRVPSHKVSLSRHVSTARRHVTHTPCTRPAAWEFISTFIDR